MKRLNLQLVSRGEPLTNGRLSQKTGISPVYMDPRTYHVTSMKDVSCLTPVPSIGNYQVRFGNYTSIESQDETGQAAVSLFTSQLHRFYPLENAQSLGKK